MKTASCNHATDHDHFDSAAIRVLLVEDQRIAAKAVIINLATMGSYIVDVAMNGQLACDLALEHDYHLILMDLGLPDMSGYEVTRFIRQKKVSEDRHIPIIALTAHSNEDTQRECFAAGIDMIVSKPLVQEKLCDVIKFAFNSSNHGARDQPLH